jgi:hypothetical protein
VGSNGVTLKQNNGIALVSVDTDGLSLAQGYVRIAIREGYSWADKPEHPTADERIWWENPETGELERWNGTEWRVLSSTAA